MRVCTSKSACKRARRSTQAQFVLFFSLSVSFLHLDAGVTLQKDVRAGSPRVVLTHVTSTGISRSENISWRRSGGTADARLQKERSDCAHTETQSEAQHNDLMSWWLLTALLGSGVGPSIMLHTCRGALNTDKLQAGPDNFTFQMLDRCSDIHARSH